MQHLWLTAALAAGLFTGSMAMAQPATPALTIAVSAPVTSMDPHYHNLTPNLALARHVFGGLTDTDDRAKVVPGLAESWQLVDERTWEFKLRRDARFHDGTPFTAEDVAFTLDRVPRGGLVGDIGAHRDGPTALRRIFRLGVTSPDSMLNSCGRISNFLIVSQRSSLRLAWVTWPSIRSRTAADPASVATSPDS